MSGAAAVAAARAPARRARLVRAALTAVVAAAGVAISALAFGALWPGGGPAPAPHAQELSPSDRAAVRAVVDRAERLVTLTPAQLGYTLRVAGPVSGIRGQTDNTARTITLFVSPDDTPNVVAHDLGHELGHAFDARALTTAQRAAYLRARGVPGAAWFPGPRASDYGSGAGDFAEVFALCHAASPVYRSRLAARPADPCAALPKQARAGKLAKGGS